MPGSEFRRRIATIAAVLLLALHLPRAAAQNATSTIPVVGPPNGSLVIAGGGRLEGSVIREFIELAGGTDAPIVIIPTASGRTEYDDSNAGLGMAQLRAAGATDLTIVHTLDRPEADSDAFVTPIRRASGVWFEGGRQWRLADAYLGTKTEAEFWALLQRGGVIGGSSAGATIQGSYLARGDTSGNEIMMGDHEEGFGFLRDTAIDQHVLRRNRQFDLIEIVRARPELLGIGIDENTAIVVQGDVFRVVGSGYVVIHDARARLAETPEGVDAPFYFLAPGDRFNLLTRQPTRPGRRGERPLGRIERDEAAAPESVNPE